MKAVSIFLLASLLIYRANAQTTQLIVIGTVHRATPNFNPDSIQAILTRIKPDLILLELDSSFFTPDFHFNFKPTDNEVIGVMRYQQRQPVLLRPFDYEGRNAYHRHIGMNRKSQQVFKKLAQLERNNQLTPSQQQILLHFRKLTDSLNAFSQQPPFVINQPTTDQLAAQRQFYQYQKLKEVVDQLTSLTDYRAFYGLNSAFWDTRNQTMVDHILQFVQLYKGKTIVVLTGYFHRYYLLSGLQNQQLTTLFVLKEYYQYKVN